MLMQTDASIIIDVKKNHQLYVAFEHLAVFAPGQPPEVIYVGVDKLIEVMGMVNARRNSEWCRIFDQGGSVMVHIIAIGDNRAEVSKHAVMHTKTFDKMPRCNIHGINMAARGVPKAIECSNGEIYSSQKEACVALGLHTSSLSRHLKGELSHVAGMTFRYKSTPR